MPIHIRAEPGDYADACLLPGDPLRAKYIAETYLDDVQQRNSERGLLGYTGTWEGKPVSVQGTGMGCPSATIVFEELVQLGVKKSPDIPADIPLGLDLARTLADRQVLEVLCAPGATGYPSFMGPGVPKDRVEAIRAAYVLAMKDPEFVELVRRQNLDLDPIGAAELTDIVRGIYAMPEATVERARHLLPAM